MLARQTPVVRVNKLFSLAPYLGDTCSEIEVTDDLYQTSDKLKSLL